MVYLNYNVPSLASFQICPHPSSLTNSVSSFSLYQPASKQTEQTEHQRRGGTRNTYTHEKYHRITKPETIKIGKRLGRFYLKTAQSIMKKKEKYH